MDDKAKQQAREKIRRTLEEIEKEGKQPGWATLKAKRIPVRLVQKVIPEGLTKFKRDHDIKLSPQEKHREKEDLLEAIDRAFSIKKEGVPRWADLEHEAAGTTQKVFYRLFEANEIREIYRQYRDFLKRDRPESKNLPRVEAYLAAEEAKESAQSQPVAGKEGGRRSKGPEGHYAKWRKPLNFGNLVYPPSNEQGVVFLFGMVSRYLGFSIESVRPQFPDCEGKRYVKKGGRDREEHVKIEFKFQSRDYEYPVEGCNLIVCWEDNWGKDCPVKVLELRSVIERLRKEVPEFRNE